MSADHREGEALPIGLVRWLAGVAPLDATTGLTADGALQTLHAEGVITLAHERLMADSCAPCQGDPDRWQEWLRRMAPDAKAAAMTSMVLESETRTILSALATTQSPALLLKGSALAHWAYPKPHLRACGDVDILLSSREAAETLAGALASAGYQRAATSGELVAYELMCTRQVTPAWAVEVDVHWRLSNTTLFAEAFTFEELLAASIALPALGPNARGLGPAHALLHAAMHRASNLMIGVGDRLKWLYDFVVLNRHLTAADWARVVTLARERRLAGVTLSALDATAAMFGTVFPQQVLAALREAARAEPLDASRLADWRYMQAQTVRALPGLALKLRWLWQRLFPSRDYMAYLYGSDGSYAHLMGLRLRQAARKWQKPRNG